jgi:5'-3' exonuclease
LDFIREEKRRPDYNPNTSHCIYGNDADLILLALATHEPRMAIYRDESKEKQMLYISKLREYMEIEFLNKTHPLIFPFNLERILDDFVFLTLFLGNDFLPE